MSAAAQSAWKPPDADRQPSAWSPPESDRTPPAEASPVAKAGKAFSEGLGIPQLLDIIRASNRYGTPQEVAARGERGMTALKGIVQGIAGEPARVWDELSRTGQAMIDPKQTTADVAYHMAGAVPFLGAPAQQAAMDLQRGDPAAFVGHVGAMVTPFVAEPAVRATAGAIEALPGAVKSAAGTAVDIAGGTSPAMREAVGVISPRTKHVLDVAARVKKARDAYLATQSAETTGTASATKPAPASGTAPVTGVTDDALLQLYSVETDPAKRAALQTQLIDRGLMNEPGAPVTPPEANPYRGYSQDALRKVYAIEPEAAKRALIEQAARDRGLTLLSREGRRATAAVPETGAAEARGPSLTQDDALMLRYLGETDPLAADAETIGIARKLAVDNPELLRRLRAGETEPIVPPPTAAEAAAPTTQAVGTLEYNAPTTLPPALQSMVEKAQQAGDFTPQEQALADHVLQNVEPQAAPAAPPPAPAPAAAPKPAAAELAQQFEATTRPDRMLDFLKRMDPEISAAAIDNLDPSQWELVARGAGSPAGTIPTPEDIAAIRGNLAQSEGASQITAKTPDAAKAQFEQNREIRSEEAPHKVSNRAAMATRFKDALAAQGITADQVGAIEPGYVSNKQITELGMQPRWGNIAEHLGEKEPSASTVAEIQRQLREHEAQGATIAPDAQSSPTTGPAAGKQSGSTGAPVHGPREPSQTTATGGSTTIRVPGESTTYQGQYAVRELDDVHASHNAQTFQRNPDYHFQNDRDYSNPTNKERVILNSRADIFDPAYPLADSPDASHGAPVIDARGNVLGGNSRAMILDRVYSNNPAGAAAYKAELVRRASLYGIDPAQIANMKRPILVRELGEGELDPQRAITNLNKTGTAALTAAERATADARTITPAAADYLASAIDAEGADASLNDVLSGKRGAEIVNKLVDDGVFTMQEKPNLVDARTGSVTAAGKERISKMLLGQVFESADQLTRTPPELRAKLERVVSPILQSSQKAGFNLLPTLRESIDLMEYARAHGISNLRDAIAQESMFGDAPKISPAAVDLAEFLRGSKPTEISKAFRRYVANAEPTMFGASTPSEAFVDAFGTSSPPATLRDLMPKASTPKPRTARKPQ